MNTEKLCFDLAMANGLPGDESEAATLARRLLSEYMPVKTDALGSVIGEKSGDGIHILLDAHIDQVGFIVRSVDESGFVLFDRCGGADVRTIVGNEVLVCGRQTLFGVVCSVPPHLAGKEKSDAIDIKKLAVDVGMSREKATELVRPGDRILYRSEPTKLLGGRISCRALDDRCGVAAVLLCLEMLSERKSSCRLTVVFSSREETGGSGAAASSFACAPDEAIAVDVGFGIQNGVDNDGTTIALGKGPSIGVSPSLDAEIQKRLERIAERCSIPYQHDVMSGETGTNSDHITVSRGGVKGALLSIPLRSMHTPVEVIELADVENTARLLCEYIVERGCGNA